MAAMLHAHPDDYSIQRAVPRLPFDSLAIVRGVGGQVLRTRDVSEHGLFIWSAHQPQFGMDLGRLLDVDVLGKHSGMRCKAVITRVAPPGSREALRFPHGMALRLVYDDAARARLRGLLEDAGEQLVRQVAAPARR
jgi:hypothetical protein